MQPVEYPERSFHKDRRALVKGATDDSGLLLKWRQCAIQAFAEGGYMKAALAKCALNVPLPRAGKRLVSIHDPTYETVCAALL